MRRSAIQGHEKAWPLQAIWCFTNGKSRVNDNWGPKRARRCLTRRDRFSKVTELVSWLGVFVRSASIASELAVRGEGLW